MAHVYVYIHRHRETHTHTHAHTIIKECSGFRNRHPWSSAVHNIQLTCAGIEVPERENDRTPSTPLLGLLNPLELARSPLDALSIAKPSGPSKKNWTPPTGIRLRMSIERVRPDVENEKMTSGNKTQGDVKKLSAKLSASALLTTVPSPSSSRQNCFPAIEVGFEKRKVRPTNCSHLEITAEGYLASSSGFQPRISTSTIPGFHCLRSLSSQKRMRRLQSLRTLRYSRHPRALGQRQPHLEQLRSIRQHQSQLGIQRLEPVVRTRKHQIDCHITALSPIFYRTTCGELPLLFSLSLVLTVIPTTRSTAKAGLPETDPSSELRPTERVALWACTVAARARRIATVNFILLGIWGEGGLFFYRRLRWRSLLV